MGERIWVIWGLGVVIGGKGSIVVETPVMGVLVTRPEADRALGDLGKKGRPHVFGHSCPTAR